MNQTAFPIRQETIKSPSHGLVLGLCLEARRLAYSDTYTNSQVPNLQQSLSPLTKSRIKLLKSLLMRHFYLEQGAARNQIPFGANRELMKIANPAYIANRAALLRSVKPAALARLISFQNDKLPDFGNTSNLQSSHTLELKTAHKSQPDLILPVVKILTIDISCLKAIDNSGCADFTLYQIAAAMVEGGEKVIEFFSDLADKPCISVYRVGGDEFSICLKTKNKLPRSRATRYS